MLQRFPGQQLQQINRAEIQKLQARGKLLSMVKRMENKLTCLHAPKRSGKTTCMTMLAVWFKKLLKKPVVVVGSDMGLLPPFGKKHVLSIGDFAEQIALISSISRDKRLTNAIDAITDVQSQKEFAKQVCLGRGIVVYDSLVLIDEMKKVSGRRHSMSKINRMFNDFYMQMGHWWITIVGSATKWIDLDDYTLEQLDWRGEVSRDEYTHEVYVDMKGKGPAFDIRFDGSMYYKFFNSRAFLGMSDSAVALSDAYV